ncbi:MAG: hypothetical protein M3323_05960 [Actinomycetota bacterium]|nr:hypothetical protein [Actinomycetota bacterium]
MLLVAAPSAHAIDIPFGTSHVIDGHDEDLPDQSEDSGVVGLCTPFQCTGVRVIERTDLAWRDTPTTLTVRGVVCVREPTAPCSLDGIPFTGVRITQMVRDTPEVSARISAYVQICFWVLAPPDAPTGCNPALPATDAVSTPDSEALGGAFPQSVGLGFSG